MGCCSSIEISVEKMRPYGPYGLSFLPRMWGSCARLNEMIVYRRYARSIDDLVARLTDDRNACTRQLRWLQIEVTRHREDSEKHARAGDDVLRDGSVLEMKRVGRSARRVMTMRSLADFIRSKAVEESIGADLLRTLERYAGIPFIQLDNARLSKIVEGVEKRSDLAADQNKMFRSLLVDLDEAEIERGVEEDLERELADPEPAASIRPRSDALAEDLARLAEIRVPAVL